jgi:hypothetical protein
MYETPELECYGTFRELTKGGGTAFTDFFGADSTGNPGCIPNPPGAQCLNS